MAEPRSWLPPRWAAHALGALNLVLLAVAATLFVWSWDVPFDGWGVRGGTFPVQVALVVMGWVLATRRPKHPIGWLLSVLQVFLGIDTVAVYLHHAFSGNGRVIEGVVPGLLQAAWVVGVVLLLHTFARFPDGELPHGRVGRFLLVLTPVTMLSVGIVAFVGGQHLGAGEPTTQAPDALALLFLPMPLFAAVALVAVVLRFHRATGVERQQLRWVVYAAVPYALTLLPAPLQAEAGMVHAVSAVGGTLLMTLVVIAMGLAILRHRLYDLDRIVSRTLAYVLLTAVVVAVWVGVALLPTVVLGSGDVDNATVAVATLAAMAVAQPLRSRIQRVIDRRLYRSRYDARQAVERLGLDLADEIDLPAVERRLVTTLAGTVQPRRVGVWVPDTPTTPS